LSVSFSPILFLVSKIEFEVSLSFVIVFTGSQQVHCTKSPPFSEALLVCGVQVTRRISKEEQRQMEKMVIIRGEKRNVEKLVGRRKYKKTYEYEVKVSIPPLFCPLLDFALQLCCFLPLMTSPLKVHLVAAFNVQ
jgi:hypothetical protein